jgi:hypothetical protein
MVTNACYPLAQVPSLSPCSWALDTNQSPQVLSVTLTGGSGGRLDQLLSHHTTFDVELSVCLSSRKITLDVACAGNVNPVVQSMQESPSLQYVSLSKVCILDVWLTCSSWVEFRYQSVLRLSLWLCRTLPTSPITSYPSSTTSYPSSTTSYPSSTTSSSR